MSRRLAFVLAASQSVAARLDEDEALHALARMAVTALADMCIIDLLEPDGRLRRAAVAHADRDIEETVRDSLRRWPPDPAGPHPVAVALRTGRPQVAADMPAGLLEATTAGPEHLRLMRELGPRSYLAVPLMARGHKLGTVLLLSASAERSFASDDVDVAEDLARLAALAVDNARLVAGERAARETAEAARRRVALLADATAVLTATLDPSAALNRLAALLVSGLADWCRVDLLREEGGVRRAALAGSDPSQAEAVRAVEDSLPFDIADNTPVGAVLRTGGPLLLEETTDDMLVATARTAEQLELYRSLGLRSLLIAPIESRGEILGALTLASAQSGRRFDADDLSLAGDVARRAALAIENARLFQREHRTAAVLQHALLPKQLPVVAGLELAARYLPATTGAEVGGDWYDVLPLADGRVGLVIGDVVGHDIEAASVMGTLRHALRAYAWPEAGAATVMRRIDDLARGPEPDMLATLVYATYDPARHTLSWTSAGHPPPLLVRPSGRTSYLVGSNSTLVGVAPDVDRTESTVGMEMGSTLVLYTDGLVERREGLLTDGLQRLAALAGTWHAATPDEMVEALLADVLAAEHRKDDVAVLVVRATS